VAARLCAAALGTDTLASIRQPAAFCGVVGIKATHGLASIRGIVPISESLDHAGPLARTVADATLVLDAIAGYDALDPVSLRSEPRALVAALGAGTAGLRLGLPREPYFERLEPDIDAAVGEALTVLAGLTRSMRDVSLPAVPSFEPLLAEAYAYHDEYLSDPDNRARYDPVTLERILAAGGFSSADYIDAHRELGLVRRAIGATFDEVDLLVTPTTPVLPDRIDEAEVPATASGAESTVRNTAPFNLYGIPTISVPCGFSRTGLPIGLQISGPALGELDMLALAHAYEQATGWHLEGPPLA
jgi:aspartyl-tRNA(Asn)/glutamyl-tRNA(Gln) amidotransferase subunit A